MDVTLTEEQELILRTATSFAQSVTTPDRLRSLEESAHAFDGEVWRRMAQLGWADVSLAAGEGEMGLFELGLIVEACGRTALPSPIFSTVIEAGLVLQATEDSDLRRSWLPRVVSGNTVMTVALLEDGGGLLSEQVQVKAAPQADGYCISGVKLFVRDAEAAEAIICVARTGAATDAVTLFVVPRGAPGVAVARMDPAANNGQYSVTFDGVAVPPDAVVGRLDAGWPLIERMLTYAAALKAVELVGIGRTALDLTVDYARSRVQFGRPIGSFQAVHHHCADMYRDLQACRLLAYQALWTLASGRRGVREAAIAKAKASEAVPAITGMAHQIHGGIGYYTDYPLGMYHRCAMEAAAAYGGAAFHRGTLSRLLTSDIRHFKAEESHGVRVHHV